MNIHRPKFVIIGVFVCHVHLVLLWQTVDGGYITMTTDTTPTKVEAWHATTLTAKRYDAAIMKY